MLAFAEYNIHVSVLDYWGHCQPRQDAIELWMCPDSKARDPHNWLQRSRINAMQRLV